MKTVYFRPAALGDLRKLDPQVARRVMTAIAEYAESDRGTVKRLHGERSEFRLRVGDWRVRFEFERPDVIRILRILHRSVAYR